MTLNLPTSQCVRQLLRRLHCQASAVSLFSSFSSQLYCCFSISDGVLCRGAECWTFVSISSHLKAACSPCCKPSVRAVFPGLEKRAPELPTVALGNHSHVLIYDALCNTKYRADIWFKAGAGSFTANMRRCRKRRFMLQEYFRLFHLGLQIFHRKFKHA